MPVPTVQIVYFQSENPDDPNWFIQVLNSGEQFRFSTEFEGAESAVQAQMYNIQQLGNLMNGYGDPNGPAELAEELPDIITFNLDQYTADQMVNKLFGETQQMLMNEETVYEVLGAEEFLIDYMVAAGEKLLECVGMLLA